MAFFLSGGLRDGFTAEEKKKVFFLEFFLRDQFATKNLIYVYLTISMSSSSAGPEMARNL